MVSSMPSILRTLTAPKARSRVMTSCTNTSGAEAPAVRPTRDLPSNQTYCNSCALSNM